MSDNFTELIFEDQSESEEKELDDLFKMLGMMYYDEHKTSTGSEYWWIIDKINMITGSDTKKCPYCGAEADDDALFCVMCGRALDGNESVNNVCPYCGNELSDGAVFCGMCGNKIGR